MRTFSEYTSKMNTSMSESINHYFLNGSIDLPPSCRLHRARRSGGLTGAAATRSVAGLIGAAAWGVALRASSPRLECRHSHRSGFA
jgi:hypothetical protein